MKTRLNHIGRLAALLGGLIAVDAAHAQAWQAQRIEGEESKKLARQLGLRLRIERENGGVTWLERFVDGRPEYYTTYNANAADTISTDDTRAHVSSLEIDGSSVAMAVWDGGQVRVTHQEFGGRAVQVDPGLPPFDVLDDHANHVAGTLIASGFTPSAKGMAPNASLNCYVADNDLVEMASAAPGLSLSNHSYGSGAGWAYGNFHGAGLNWYFFGDPGVSEAAGFGMYNWVASKRDEIAYNAPGYLMFTAAGNARGGGPPAGTGHYHWVVGMGYVWYTDTHTQGPFDIVGGDATAKNVMAVGAVEDIPGGWTEPADVVSASFSSWGPTDDGRIKPDVVANGVNLYSCFSSADDVYQNSSGTSMSSPSACGSAAVLLDYWNQLHSQPDNPPDNGPATLSATLKGLIIHTAREAGPADGPDYMFGWGLMDTLAAAVAIKHDRYNPDAIQELVLPDPNPMAANPDQIEKRLPGVRAGQKIRVTICWTDPEHAALFGLDDPTRVLINDLDLRVIHNGTGTIYYPWRLDPADPSAAATRDRDNDRDNVEVVDFTATQAGDYTLRVAYKGTLQGGTQEFALLVGGVYSDVGGNAFAPGLWLLDQSAFLVPSGTYYSDGVTINTPVTIYAAGGEVTIGD